MGDEMVLYPESDPEPDWRAAADQLDVYADRIETDVSVPGTTVARAAMPLIRRLDPDAAVQLEAVIRMTVGRNDRQYAEMIRGVATATRLMGGPPKAAAGTASQVTNVKTEATAMSESVAVASANATAVSCAQNTLDVMLEWPGLPEGAVAELEGIKRAIADGDKKSFVEHLGEASKVLAGFPVLANACVELGTSIGGFI